MPLIPSDGTPGDSSTFGCAQGLVRFFGDTNGALSVNGLDFGVFRTAFGTSAGSPAYLDSLDHNANGAINGVDFSPFRTRFGTTLP